MKKACFFVHRPYQKNEVFKAESLLNRDNGFQFFIDLKNEFLKHGIELQTQDLCSPQEAEFIIYNEMPADVSRVEYPQKSFVLLFESELIRPNDWNLENHKKFKKIFTWNDDFVDNQKYIKFNFTHAGRSDILYFSEKKNFCTLVAGNKYVSHPLELYSERVKAIEWFEKFHPEDFSFFGIGWDYKIFKNKFLNKVQSKVSILKKARKSKWKTFRGRIENKNDTLKSYKFIICYENAKGIKGYITEKILDALASGCIPIYWGAPNIADFIPKDCYIEKTDFSSYEELYQFMKAMPESEYNRRIDCIKSFLTSEKHLAFDPLYNAQVVVKGVLGG